MGARSAICKARIAAASGRLQIQIPSSHYATTNIHNHLRFGARLSSFDEWPAIGAWQLGSRCLSCRVHCAHGVPLLAQLFREVDDPEDTDEQEQETTPGAEDRKEPSKRREMPVIVLARGIERVAVRIKLRLKLRACAGDLVTDHQVLPF